MAGFRDRIKGKYAIDKKLGAGSFGEVFTCWNTDKSHVDELLVVKIIHIGAAGLDSSSHSSVASKNAQADAQREAKILKKLNHKHIIQFHDSFIFRDEFCIVTEFCDGGDLEDFMNQRKEVSQAIPYSLVLKWTRQLLEALDYMHSFQPKPIVHRDIKSRNVFLKSNQIKLGDMGVSRVLAETFANTFLGTPFYMSPEMIRDSKYDSKSDIWALGCVLSEMITFKRSYEGDSLMRILWKIVEDPVPRIQQRNLRDKACMPIVDIINKMMVKDVNGRLSAAQLLEEDIFSSNSRESSASSRQSSKSSNSRPDSGNRFPSRTEFLGEPMSDTVKELTVKARTFHRVVSRSSGNSESNGSRHSSSNPKEIEIYEQFLGSIEQDSLLASDQESISGSEESSNSEENSSSEDEDVALAREIMAGKSQLYRDKDTNKIPENLPKIGRDSINESGDSHDLRFQFGRKKSNLDQDDIGVKIIEKRSKRIYDKCIQILGDVNFKHAYRFLRRVYESGKAGDPNVMDGLIDLIGTDLAKKCMIVEELIMAEEQNRS